MSSKNTAAGASAQFTQAYQMHAKAIFRHCNMQLRNKDVAQEVMQEAFMKTWEYLQSGHDIENIKTFLYRVADNLIVDEVRRRKRREELSLETLHEMGFDPGDDDMVPQMENEIDVWRVLAQVRKYREKEFRILSMRFLRGMQHAEIASEMGISPRTVAVYLHRLLKKMKSTKLY